MPRTVSMNERAELPPQPRDEDLDGVRVAIEALRVDVLGQFRLRNDAAAMVHQVREHAKLVARQLDGRAVDGDARASRIEHDRPARSSGVTWPLARRISARNRASTSSIWNGLAT